MDDETAPPAHVPTRGLYGHITHTDLASRDPAATRAWCAAVFGWDFARRRRAGGVAIGLSGP